MNKDIKKRIMFIKGEDYYFLTYNILILLKTLDCFENTKKFRDYRKISYLIDFISDSNLINILERYEQTFSLNFLDKELLTRAYSNGMIRSSQILRLLFSLEKKGLIILERDSDDNELLDFYLKKENYPVDFFSNEIFNIEFQNANKLKQIVKRLSVLKFETVLDKLFKKYGISIWAAY
jgi:hypothetical protein